MGTGRAHDLSQANVEVSHMSGALEKAKPKVLGKACLE